MTQRMTVESMSDLLLNVARVYSWKYDSTGELLVSNCPDEAVLDKAFDLFGCKKRAVEYGQDHHYPISLRTEPGLIWYATYEWEEDSLRFIYVIGPVLYTEMDHASLNAFSAQFPTLSISIERGQKLLHALRHIPLTQCTMMMTFILMLHYAITGEKLLFSDIDTETELSAQKLPQEQGDGDRYKIWNAEQAMLQIIRNGDLDYRQVLANVMGLSTGVGIFRTNALTKSRISVIVFTSIVCRAAIEGGLSPEEAYRLGDSYIETVASIKNPSDLQPLALSMYDDFVRRVHRQRSIPTISKEIRKCCDYINMHLGQKLTAEVLAERVGYAKYYLTQKFKEETGKSISSYVRDARIEKAKLFLVGSEKSIDELAIQLGFGSRSFFSREFQKAVGTSPAEYRKNHLKPD